MAKENRLVKMGRVRRRYLEVFERDRELSLAKADSEKSSEETAYKSSEAEALRLDFAHLFSSYYKRTGITGWVDMRRVLGGRFSDFIDEAGNLKFSLGEATFRQTFRMPASRYPDLGKFGWTVEDGWCVITVSKGKFIRRYVAKPEIIPDSCEVGGYLMLFKPYRRVVSWVDVSQMKRKRKVCIK